jgi:hypothetical protein
MSKSKCQRNVKFSNLDEFIKSPKGLFSVIPAKAGIQSFSVVGIPLDSRSPIKDFEDKFHGNDNLLGDHQTIRILFFDI